MLKEQFKCIYENHINKGNKTLKIKPEHDCCICKGTGKYIEPAISLYSGEIIVPQSLELCGCVLEQISDEDYESADIEIDRS